jgi:hypothetical protein
MSKSTSIGPGQRQGGNENHSGDPLDTTLGEDVRQQEEPPKAGELIDEASPDMPSGVKGSEARQGIAKAPQSYPDGPNVEASPWELDAARGKVPKP